MPRGRRTILNQVLIEEIVRVIRAGNYIKVACQYVGISEAVYHKWVRRGEAEITRREDIEELDEKAEREEIFVQFVVSCARARAEAEAEAVARVREIARGKVRGIELDENGEPVYRQVDDRIRLDAEKFYLERSFPERWGRQKIDHDVKITNTKLKLIVQEPGVVGTQESDED